MNINPNRCRYCHNYFCCESHRIDHEVKHHKKPTLPLWIKNKNISKQKINNNNNNNETKLQNKQQFDRINKPVITETTEVKAKRLSRKRQHSCIINTEQTMPDMLLNTVTFTERKILKPKFKSEIHLDILKKAQNVGVQPDTTKINKEDGLSCVTVNINNDPNVKTQPDNTNIPKEDVPSETINKKLDPVNKEHDSANNSDFKMTNEIKMESLFSNTVSNKISNQSRQDTIDENFDQPLLAEITTNTPVQSNFNVELYPDSETQNLYDGNTDSPLTDIRKEPTCIIVSPISDGGSPPGKTSTPITSDQENMSLKINETWCTALQNSSLLMYKSSSEKYLETSEGLVSSTKETEDNQAKTIPAVTPLRGIMKNSKLNSFGNETLNSTNSLSKLRHVTFSDTQSIYLTQNDLLVEQPDTPTQSSHFQGMFKTVADFVTSAFQSLPGFILSSSETESVNEMTDTVPKTAKRIRSPDSNSSSGYSPSHKRRCYHCYLKQNPIRKRRSISACPTRFD